MHRGLIALGCVALLVACGDATDEGHEHAHHHEEVPAQYANLTNPLTGDADAIAAGQEIFAQRCATCHGDDAKGDGPGGASLDPRPTDLTVHAQAFTDGFLYWRIAEGLDAMPAYATALSEAQIWQAITFIRSLTL